MTATMFDMEGYLGDPSLPVRTHLSEDLARYQELLSIPSSSSSSQVSTFLPNDDLPCKVDNEVTPDALEPVKRGDDSVTRRSTHFSLSPDDEISDAFARLSPELGARSTLPHEALKRSASQAFTFPGPTEEKRARLMDESQARSSSLPARHHADAFRGSSPIKAPTTLNAEAGRPVKDAVPNDQSTDASTQMWQNGSDNNHPHTDFSARLEALEIVIADGLTNIESRFLEEVTKSINSSPEHYSTSLEASLAENLDKKLEKVLSGVGDHVKSCVSGVVQDVFVGVLKGIGGLGNKILKIEDIVKESQASQVQVTQKFEPFGIQLDAISTKVDALATSSASYDEIARISTRQQNLMASQEAIQNDLASLRDRQSGSVQSSEQYVSKQEFTSAISILSSKLDSLSSLISNEAPMPSSSPNTVSSEGTTLISEDGLWSRGFREEREERSSRKAGPRLERFALSESDDTGRIRRAESLFGSLDRSVPGSAQNQVTTKELPATQPVQNSRDNTPSSTRGLRDQSLAASIVTSQQQNDQASNDESTGPDVYFDVEMGDDVIVDDSLEQAQEVGREIGRSMSPLSQDDNELRAIGSSVEPNIATPVTTRQNQLPSPTVRSPSASPSHGQHDYPSLPGPSKLNAQKTRTEKAAEEELTKDIADRRKSGRRAFPTQPRAIKYQSQVPLRRKTMAGGRIRKYTAPKVRMTEKALGMSNGEPRGKGKWPPKGENTVQGRLQDITCAVCKGLAHWMCAGLADDEPPPEGDWQCPDCREALKSGQNRHLIPIAPQHTCIRGDCVLRLKKRVKRVDGDEEMYIVERLIGRRAIARNEDSTRVFEHLVKWMGWPLEQSTWEPEANLPNHQRFKDAFLDELKYLEISHRPRVVLLPEAKKWFDEEGHLKNGHNDFGITEDGEDEGVRS